VTTIVGVPGMVPCPCGNELDQHAEEGCCAPACACDVGRCPAIAGARTGTLSWRCDRESGHEGVHCAFLVGAIGTARESGELAVMWEHDR